MIIVVVEVTQVPHILVDVVRCVMGLRRAGRRCAGSVARTARDVAPRVVHLQLGLMSGLWVMPGRDLVRVTAHEVLQAARRRLVTV